MSKTNSDYYVLIVKQNGIIKTNTFNYGEESQMIELFTTTRLLGFIDDAVLLKNDECIAFGEQYVYSAAMNLVFSYHINNQGDTNVRTPP